LIFTHLIIRYIKTNLGNLIVLTLVIAGCIPLEKSRPNRGQ